jgi:hypothetical protein
MIQEGGVAWASFVHPQAHYARQPFTNFTAAGGNLKKKESSYTWDPGNDGSTFKVLCSTFSIFFL